MIKQNKVIQANRISCWLNNQCSQGTKFMRFSARCSSLYIFLTITSGQEFTRFETNIKSNLSYYQQIHQQTAHN